MQGIENRKRLREQVSKRGSITNKRRLQVMAGLIQVNENEDITHHQPGKENDKSDMFGMEDDDWDIYRGINKMQNFEEDEEDQESIAQIEKQIADIDPQFHYMMHQANTKMPTEEDF